MNAQLQDTNTNRNTSNIQPDSEQLFEYISSYPFSSDQEYQSGLAAILGHPETPATAEETAQNQDLVLQAQCFYLARRHQLPPINVDGYSQWLQTQTRTRTQSGSQDVEPNINGTVAAVAAQPKQQSAGNTLSATNNDTSTIAGPSAPAPDPIERPHAPTPSTAAAASTLNVQPRSQATNTDRPAEAANTASGQGPAPPYPTSFADIVDLITQNKPVPGIEEVPDTVLELGSSKRDTATRRRKPWEKDDIEQDTEGTATDTGRQSGEGVLKILQPGAVPDSGLIAGD